MRRWPSLLPRTRTGVTRLLALFAAAGLAVVLGCGGPGPVSAQDGADEERTRTIDLAAGWNLIGWPAETSIAEAVSGLGGDFQSVNTFDAGSGTFSTFVGAG